ncbi:MAG: anthranilate phosphoribosyltransferase, partial [Polyangiales bacterium]
MPAPLPLPPFSHTLDRLLAGESLSSREMEIVIGRVLDGESTPSQIAALLVALRAKGERPEEIAAAARALRSRMKVCAFAANDGVVVLDTCGTGGDGSSSFNVSTVAAIVVAACGVIVAKHGNRAISSRSGSADLIEALGVPIAPPPSSSADDEARFDTALERSLHRAGIAFLFAPRHHAALRHAAAVRKELGVRTIFNLLGPLANPALASHQLLGVYDDRFRAPLAEVLGELGLRGAWVVHGEACEGAPRGLDEVSPAGPTRVTVLN